MAGSARIWQSSVARRALVGAERTHNPSPAAASLIARRFGKRKLKGAISFLGKRRRRFHRGNPLPAALGVLGSLGGLGKLGKRFRPRAEARAGGMVAAIVAAANAGNLTAARGLIERAAHPMNAKESALWKAAAAQLAPKIRAAVMKHAELIPAADQSGPEQFQASIAASPVQLGELEAAEREEAASRRSAAAGRAAREDEAAERREARLTELGAAGLTALAGRGRRPARRRKKRRTRARTIRL